MANDTLKDRLIAIGIKDIHTLSGSYLTGTLLQASTEETK